MRFKYNSRINSMCVLEIPALFPKHSLVVTSDTGILINVIFQKIKWQRNEEKKNLFLKNQATSKLNNSKFGSSLTELNSLQLGTNLAWLSKDIFKMSCSGHISCLYFFASHPFQSGSIHPYYSYKISFTETINEQNDRVSSPHLSRLHSNTEVPGPLSPQSPLFL